MCTVTHEVLEALTENKFDLHVVGTSLDQKKILGHQVTLGDSQKLSLGFTTIAKEDSQSLLDITLQLFQEITDVSMGSEEEKNKMVRDIFKNMTSCMSDRAATMKLFKQKLSSMK